MVSMGNSELMNGTLSMIELFVQIIALKHIDLGNPEMTINWKIAFIPIF